VARNGLISGCLNVAVGRARKGVMRPTNTLTAPNQKLTSIHAHSGSRSSGDVDNTGNGVLSEQRALWTARLAGLASFQHARSQSGHCHRHACRLPELE
jgi:hypothetical protein